MEYLQKAIQTQTNRNESIRRYNDLLNEIENWLLVTNIEINYKDIEKDQLEVQLIAYLNLLKKINEKYKSLVDLKEELSTVAELQRLSVPLTKQINKNLEVIDSKKKAIEVIIAELETQIIDNKQKKELEPIKVMQDINTQTLEALQTAPIETHEMSAQTQAENLQTDNILVIQSIANGQETIQISSVSNVNPDDTNVFVEAKYRQADEGDENRSSELLLMNVPKKFETTFVEPDETTTEIIVDPDGSKKIIVKKLTRTTQHVVIDNMPHQKSSISTIVGAPTQETGPENKVVEYVQTQTERPKLSIDNVDHESLKGMMQDNEMSEIHAVVHQVSRTVIRKRRRIIKRITIIDGVETVTEEVIEEPDEIEENTEEVPQINLTLTKDQISYAPGPSNAIEHITTHTSGATTTTVERIVEVTEPVVTSVTPVVEDILEQAVDVIESIQASPIISHPADIPEKETSGDVIITPEIVEIAVIEKTVVSEAITVPGKEIPQIENVIEKVVEDEIPAESTPLQDLPLMAASPVTTEPEQVQEQIIESPEIRKEGDDVDVQIEDSHQVLESNTAQVELIALTTPILNAQNEVEIENDIIETIPAVTAEIISNITDIWPSTSHISHVSSSKESSIASPPLVFEPSQNENIPSTLSIEDLRNIENLQNIWPINANIGFDEQSPDYTYTIQTNIDETKITAPIAPAQDENTIEIEQRPFVEAVLSQPESVEEKTEISAPREDVKRPKVYENIEVIEAAVESLPVIGDEIRETVILSMPAAHSDKQSSITVSMSVNPNETTKLNVNLIEAISESAPAPAIDSVIELVEQPTIIAPPISIVTDSDYKGYEPEDKTAVEETEEDSKGKQKKRKKKKQKSKEHLLDPKPEEKVPAATDLPVSNVPAIEENEKYSVISPDESYKSLAESEDDAIRIVEESIVQSPPESLNPLNTQLIIATEILESTHVDDIAQQTSPSLPGEVEVDKLTIEIPVLDFKSSQTSPAIHDITNISAQTSPLPKIDQIEMEVQTTIVTSEVEMQTMASEAPTVELVSEEVQTDEMPLDVVVAPAVETVCEGVQTDEVEGVPTADGMNQTASVATVEQELQTMEPTDEIVNPIVSNIITSTLEDTIRLQTAEAVVQTTPEKVKPPIKKSMSQSLMQTDDITTEHAHIQTMPIEIPEEAIPKEEIEKVEAHTSTDVVEPEARESTISEVQTTPVTITLVKTTEEIMIQTTPVQFKDSEGEIPAQQTIVDVTEPIAVVDVPVQEIVDEPVVEEVPVSATPAATSEPEKVIIEEVIEPTVDASQASYADDDNSSSLGSFDVEINASIIMPDMENIHPDQVTTVVTRQVEKAAPGEKDVVNIKVSFEVDEMLQPKVEEKMLGRSSNNFIEAEAAASPDTRAARGTDTNIWAKLQDKIQTKSDLLQNADKQSAFGNIVYLTMLNNDVEGEQSNPQRLQNIKKKLKTLKKAKDNDPANEKIIYEICEYIITTITVIEYRYLKIQQYPNEAPDSTELLNEVKTISDNVNELLNLTASKSANNTENVKSCVKAIEELNFITKNHIIATGEQKTIDTTQQLELEGNLLKFTKHIHDLEEIFKEILASDIPINDKLNKLDQLEESNKNLIKNTIDLLNRPDFLNTISEESLSNLCQYHDKSLTLEKNIEIEKSRFYQLLSLAEEYEQTLNEFSEITLIANRLVESPIITNTLEQLQEEMQKHRKFFVNLNHCKSILESLEFNLDNETRNKHADFHKTLYDRATNILEKAADRARKLALSASRWTVLEKKMNDEKKWIQVAQQRIPDLTAVTSMNYNQYVTLYQSLNSDIDLHHAKILENHELAKKMQEHISAPNMEKEGNDELIILIKLKEEVNVYLSKLVSFHSSWTEYNKLADKLENWIIDAEKEIDQIEMPIDFKNQPIKNIRNFWNIKSKYEIYNNVHTDIGYNFDKALRTINMCDENLQRQFYSQLEDHWSNISHKIHSVQSRIIDSINDTNICTDEKLQFIAQELEELNHNFNNTNRILKNREEIVEHIELLNILQNRLTIVDTELSRIGLLSDTDNELITHLFCISHKISSQIIEELDGAELLRDQLTYIQKEVGRIRTDLKYISETVGQCEDAQSQDSSMIKKAIIDCNNSILNLSNTWKDIMKLRQILHTRPRNLKISSSLIDYEREISELQDTNTDLENRCAKILSNLKTRLGLWINFEEQLDNIHQQVHETEYMVELITMHGNFDFNRISNVHEKLEVSIFSRPVHGN